MWKVQSRIILHCLLKTQVCVCAHVCVWTGAHEDQKRVSNPLELEVQAVVSHQIGAGSKLVSLQEQQALLISEPFLQPLSYFSLFNRHALPICLI